MNPEEGNFFGVPFLRCGKIPAMQPDRRPTALERTIWPARNPPGAIVRIGLFEWGNFLAEKHKGRKIGGEAREIYVGVFSDAPALSHGGGGRGHRGLNI
jgi:hypothetical protein